MGDLYNLAYRLERKIVEPPLFVQTIFGILGGIGAEPRNLMFTKETAEGDGGPAVRERLRLVHPGGRAAADGVHYHGRDHWRACAGGTGGQSL